MSKSYASIAILSLLLVCFSFCNFSLSTLRFQVQSYMVENGIDVREYNSVDSDVSLLACGKLISSYASNRAHGEIQKARENGKIWIDPVSCCLALYAKLASDQVLMQQSPLARAKALKVC